VEVLGVAQVMAEYEEDFLLFRSSCWHSNKPGMI